MTISKYIYIYIWIEVNLIEWQTLTNGIYEVALAEFKRK